MISAISPINTFPQKNFDPKNLPPQTEGFYNTAGFASNQTSFLSAQVSAEEKAQLKGLEDIKNAINDET